MEEEEKRIVEKSEETDNTKSSSSDFKRPDAKGYVDSSSKSKNEKFEQDKLKNNREKNRNNYVSDIKSFASDLITTTDNEETGEDDSLLITEMIEAKSNDYTSSLEGQINFFDTPKGKSILIGAVVGGFLLILLLFVAILTGKIPNSGIAGGDNEENIIIKELKTKINEVKSNYSSKYGVSIDGKLILATLVAYQDTEKYSFDSIEISYMISKIELLAKYQIMTKAKCDYDSSTIRKIASNDKNGLFDKEEKNYKCDSSSDDESYSLSIDRGDFDDDNSGGVYYWNLIDGDFVPDYYSSYVSKDDKSSKKAISSIVDQIYDYYEAMPDDDEDAEFCGVVYAQCPGVTVSGYGTYDLETYVAGVLAAEPGYTMVNDELGKYNAIIIRSFTLAHTNNCKNPITASSNEQNFTPSETYKKYAEETAGMVMTDSSGEIIEAVYSLATAGDCEHTSDGKCKFRRCTKFANSVSSCSGKVTEFVVPYGTITYQSHDIHYGGSEPFIAKYLSVSEGYTYDKLLKAFYGDDITIAKLSSSAGSGGDLCGAGSNDKYWWPSGSSATNNIGGKVFAKGTPQSVSITNNFGCGGENAWRTTGCHGGLDIGLGCGSNVIAAKGGTVVYTNDGCPTYGEYENSCGNGYGNHVMIEHPDGNYTLYGHMSLNGVKVLPGETVAQGQLIGFSGSSGSSTGCHLHFEVRNGSNNMDSRVDPLKYVDPKNPRPQGGNLNHVKGDSVKQEICLSLKASGFSNNGIAAILTNINAESSFDPNVVGDSGTSYGLCQWHEGRWDNLKKFTSEWKTSAGQLQFLIHELKTNYLGLYNSLLNGSSSAIDLSNRYCTDFEVPADTISTCSSRANSYSREMASYVNNNCR